MAKNRKNLFRFAHLKKLNIYFRMFKLLMFYFHKKKILSVAQSLAYTTILSLVPILVIFFFVLGKIAKTEIKNDIMDFVSVYFFPEYVNSIFNELETLSQRSMALGIIGFPTFFLAAVLLYSRVEFSINDIWSATKKQKWFRSSLAFFMTLIFGPAMLVLVFSIPPTLQTLPFYQEVSNIFHFKTLITLIFPIGFSTLGLFILYIYIPAVFVNRTAAMWGAFIASIFIQIFNSLVSSLFIKFSNFDIIYGSLSIIPVFLIWVFLFWVIVLSGAAIAFVIQTHHETGYLRLKGNFNDENLLTSAIQILVYLNYCFEKLRGAPEAGQLSVMLGFSKERLHRVMDILMEENFVTAFESESKSGNFRERYQLGLSADQIYLRDLVPMFYQPRDHLVFSPQTNQLLQQLEVHPAILSENLTIKDIYTHKDAKSRELT